MLGMCMIMERTIMRIMSTATMIITITRMATHTSTSVDEPVQSFGNARYWLGVVGHFRPLPALTPLKTFSLTAWISLGVNTPSLLVSPTIIIIRRKNPVSCALC